MSDIKTRIALAKRLKVEGFTILPLKTDSRNPSSDKWELAVKNDPEVFLNNAGTQNYGTLPPPDDAIFDIDSGADVFLRKKAEELGVTLPATRAHRSPHGWHYIYALPEGVPRPKSPWWGTIIVRYPFGDEGQGYVVGPGCEVAEPKKDKGIRGYYDIVRDVPIATLPEALVRDALTFKQRKTNGAAGELFIELKGYVMPEVIETNTRYGEIVKFTASLWNKGMSKEQRWLLVKYELAPRFREPKTERELRSDFERAEKDMPERLGEPAWKRRESEEPGPTPEHLTGLDADALLDLDIPPLREVIPGLLPEGLIVLGAPPKAGKSLLAYQMSVETAFGGELFGLRVERRKVLYYALEDGRRRSKQRIRALLNGRRRGIGNLEVRWTAPRLGKGLEKEVGEWLDANPEGVVIIDVLAKVRPSGKSGVNAYDEDYQALDPLQTVTRTRQGSTIVLVTHDRKAGSDDWLTRITGTRGVTGAADAALFIHRKRGEDFANIHATGRDIADLTLPVMFAGDHWEEPTIAGLVGRLSRTRQAIWNWLNENGPAMPKAVAEGTGFDGAVVRNRLSDMLADGQVWSVPEGYTVEEPQPTPPEQETPATPLRPLHRYSEGVTEYESNDRNGTLWATRTRGDDSNPGRARMKGTVTAEGVSPLQPVTADVHVECRDYLNHRSYHRMEGGRFVCDACDAGS